ncbi:unnamed protein product [Brachionus calyciflorus]|uniref:mitogen-activated protein kinase kinase n=1 Tax=Brachionus calyciflorus TaxID=104777 RepID=A0A814JUH4_9BILA|nr:unnamed protein product [Brachionus calyciflorus]
MNKRIKNVQPLKSLNEGIPQIPELSLKLQRTCEITIEIDGLFKTFTISYDDVKNGEKIGSGEYGEVFKVYFKEADIYLAVKNVVYKEMLAVDKRNARIMDLEVALKVENKCENLIKFFGAILAEGHIWIVSELMDAPLDRFYLTGFEMQGQIPELFISKVAHAVLNALTFLKEIKIMHRDIKPSNILLNYNGQIKLCDFGISGFTDNSVCKTLKGTRRYIAPEKICSTSQQIEYCIKSDIWSLGITIIEIATGKNPFHNIQNDLVLSAFIEKNDPPRLDASIFSLELCDFVRKCVQKIPEKRSSHIELLEHKFINKYLDCPNDLEYIKLILDEVKKDVFE